MYTLLIVSDSLLPHIMSVRDPRLVWVKLRDLYQPKSMNRQLILKQQLYSLKMTHKTTIDEYLRTINTLTSELANIGVVIPDEELVDRVLTSLPSNWNVFKQMVYGRERIHVLS
jgi:hypothetical protein